MSNILYTSKHGLYNVVVVDGDDNYGVFNIETEKVEYKSDSLPQTIGVCEQYDFMLHHKTWNDVLLEMFGPEEEWENVKPQLTIVDPDKQH